ncbi:MAG TPA: hypothetical protein VLD59_17370 [Steroidobacteraceae bacterium]|nr:hypothetical protein [Steroidobacteraceae bacterium]
MSAGTRSIRNVCASVAALLIAQLLLSCANKALISSQPVVIADLQIGRDYQGPVRRIAFDASGEAWMATSEALYRVQDGKPIEVDKRARPGQQLLVAPDGGMYAWLIPGDQPPYLHYVELLELPKKPIATLRLPDFPYGFGTLYLGGSGNLIVTVTPLDNAEGLSGDFLYVFWSRDGSILSRATVAGPRIVVTDVGGEAILLIGTSDAVAFRNDGLELWRLSGRFRKAALGGKGNTALLNPAEKGSVHEVHVFHKARVTTVTMAAPVYDLALTADGSQGAVAIGKGEILFITPQTCNGVACAPVRAAGSADGNYQITMLRFVSEQVLAVGKIKEVGAAPRLEYPEGALAALSVAGDVLIERVVPLEQPATWSPSIDASYSAPVFGAHTPHRAYIVRLNP